MLNVFAQGFFHDTRIQWVAIHRKGKSRECKGSEPDDMLRAKNRWQEADRRQQLEHHQTQLDVEEQEERVPHTLHMVPGLETSDNS